MKFLVLFSCALAVVAAQWGPAHHGAYHVPVIGPHGVPVDTPEVQHARAAHLAALSQASQHAGPAAYHGGYDNGQYNDNGAYNNAPHDEGHYRYHGPAAYQTTHGAAKVTHDGVPLDTPEVAAAKAHHFSAFSEALSRAAHHGPSHHYRKRRSYGVYGHHGAYHGPQHIPVIGPHGVPVDTPEVQHARAAHFHALAAANHGGGPYDGGYDGGHYAAGPVYAHGYHHGFQGLDHDGRPLDTPEVAHAKAAHFAAYDEAAHRNGVHGHHGHVAVYAGHYAHGYPNGAPHDTPEVAHAKAAHFAAHAAARGHGHY